MKRKFTDEQEQYIKDNYLNYTYEEIAKHLGEFTGKQVRTWACQNGLRKNRVINNSYFNSIDTSLKAYLIGFIYADGWISRHEFGMELQSQYKYVLEKINEELGGKNIIYHQYSYEHYICNIKTLTKDMDCLRIYSKPLVESLIKNGISYNKTKTDIFPIVDEQFFFDWLRGYIDGDGCFYINKNNDVIMNITCSSLIPLQYIQNKLDKYNIQTSIYTEKDKKHRLVCYNRKSIIQLVNRLYYKDDLFYLTRKYEKIKHLLGFAA